MSTRDDLLNLERAGWRALATGGQMAADHYDEQLADQVLMLLPGGLVIDERDTAIDAMSGSPWDAFELTEERVLELEERVAVVAYRATARRAEQDYEALISSTYVRQGGDWKVALHQQTPV